MYMTTPSHLSTHSFASCSFYYYLLIYLLVSQRRKYLPFSEHFILDSFNFKFFFLIIKKMYAIVPKYLFVLVCS